MHAEGQLGDEGAGAPPAHRTGRALKHPEGTQEGGRVLQAAVKAGTAHLPREGSDERHGRDGRVHVGR